MQEKELLDKYNINKYWKPSVAADILLFTLDQKDEINELKVLLIKRGGLPFKDSWALPGGFLEKDETLLETANRELEEETNIKNVGLQQLAVWDNPDRDPRGRIISLAFIGITQRNNININSGDDANAANLFSLGVKKVKDNIVRLSITNNKNSLIANIRVDMKNYFNSSIEKSKGLAFDHAKIIYYGLQYLLSKAQRDRIRISSEKIHIENEEFCRLKKDLEECINEAF